MARTVVCLLLLAAAVSGKHEIYEGHQLYRVSGPVQEISNLDGPLDILSASPAMRSTSGQVEALVRLSPEEKQQWLRYFEEKNMPYTLIIDNLATLLREQDAINSKARLTIKTRNDGSDETPESSSDGEASSESSGDGESLPESSGDGESSPESSGDGESSSESSGDGESSPESSGDGESSPESSGDGESSPESSGDGESSSESSGDSEASSEQTESGESEEQPSTTEEPITTEKPTTTEKPESEEETDVSISWDAYQSYEEINDWLDNIAQRYPQYVVVVNAALSSEGRQIKYVRISSTRFEDLRKPVIVIDAAAHAREWVTPPVALYIIEQLVVNAVDSTLLENLDWIIIPLVNPDGYVYSMTEARMWRKTRSVNHPGSTLCPGVDVNRNFDHYHGTTSSAANPCAITYEGPTAFSEPETRVVRDAILQNINRATLYISLHSYGNMFLYAWGNNGTLPSNGLALHLAGIEMATAIDRVSIPSANRYIVGNAANVLYFTTGTSRDWTRAAGVPLTYTLELPGYSYGFLVPATYIRQIITETWEGISAGAYHVLRDYAL